MKTYVLPSTHFWDSRSGTFLNVCVDVSKLFLTSETRVASVFFAHTGMGSVSDPHFFARNKFLFSNFTSEAKAFGLCVFGRGIAVAVISTLFRDLGVIVQVASVCVVIVIYMSTLSKYSPWILFCLKSS